MFCFKVDIDGREITKSYLETLDIEKLLEEIQKVNNVEDCEVFLLKHGENIVDRVGVDYLCLSYYYTKHINSSR